MKALTLWPEWAAAVAYLGKDVENRGWAPPGHLIGQRIAIHAGKHIGGRAGEPAFYEGRAALQRMVPDPLDANLVCKRGGVYLLWQRGDALAQEVLLATSAIVATARLQIARRYSHPRPDWAVSDAWHWVLQDVRRLWGPVPCRGAQGLWDVPDELLTRVLAQEVAS